MKKTKDDSIRELKALADQHRAELAACRSEYEGQISSLQNIHKAEIEKFEEELSLAQSAQPSVDTEMLTEQLAEKTQRFVDAEEELDRANSAWANMEAVLKEEIRQLKEENEVLKKKAAGIPLFFSVLTVILLCAATNY